MGRYVDPPTGVSALTEARENFEAEWLGSNASGPAGMHSPVTGPHDSYAAAKKERQQHVEAVTRSLARKKLVVAGPGTGKTFLFKSVLQGKTNTLTLTFVNALVEDLSFELFRLSEVKTLHAFARGQLQEATRKDVRIYPKLSQVIKQDAGIILGADVDFDCLFHNREDADTRIAFYRSRRKYYDHYGFAALVYAAVLYLEAHPDKIPEYTQVVVDEFQDFNALEVSLIDLLAKRSPILLAGDDDQALYESLKSASPQHIRQRHAGESGDYACFNLPYCSRSTKVIVDAANDLIKNAKKNGLLKGRIEKPFKYFPDSKKDLVCQANPTIAHATLFPTQLGWFIQREIGDITEQLRSKFTTLVLSPTRVQCKRVFEALTAKGFQNMHFADKNDDPTPSLLDGLKLLLLDDHCNLGWRIVLKDLLDSKQFEIVLRQTSDAHADRKLIDLVEVGLREKVGRLLTTLRGIRDGRTVGESDMEELLKMIGIDPRANAARSLQDAIAPSRRPVSVEPGIAATQITVTTIQSSKGLDADYVFITHFDNKYLVRNKDSGLSDQDLCSVLVAVTRARAKLYLLSTDLSHSATLLSWIDADRLVHVQVPSANAIRQ